MKFYSIESLDGIHNPGQHVVQNSIKILAPMYAKYMEDPPDKADGLANKI